MKNVLEKIKEQNLYNIFDLFWNIMYNNILSDADLQIRNKIHEDIFQYILEQCWEENFDEEC